MRVVFFTTILLISSQINAQLLPKYTDSLKYKKDTAILGLSNKKEIVIDFKKPHQPLLFIAGTKDNIIPATLNRRNFKRYKDKNSVTEFKEFDNNHFVLGLPNWQQTASVVYDWIQQH